MLRQKLLIFLALFLIEVIIAQLDCSKSWEDFSSYDDVENFAKAGYTTHVLADNAVFTCNIGIQQTQKYPSIQELLGGIITAIRSSECTDGLIIGYENELSSSR